MLDDLNIQTNVLMDRENYLHQIQALRQQHKRVITEYNDFINWCKVVQLSVGGDEDVTYGRQRDALRF